MPKATSFIEGAYITLVLHPSSHQ